MCVGFSLQFSYVFVAERERSLQVRFSNDKTPYKTNFSASFSRGGRKGIFAHCGFHPSFTRLCVASLTALSTRLYVCVLLYQALVSI